LKRVVGGCSVIASVFRRRSLNAANGS
jgi:hypothetical protein